MPPRRLDVMVPWLRHVVVMALATAVFLPRSQAQKTQQVQMAADSGVTIEITNVTGDIPQRGFAPLRITINNTSNRDGEWRMNSNASATGFYRFDKQLLYCTELTCDVPAHSERVFELLAPLPTEDARSYHFLNLTVLGPSVERRSLSWSNNMPSPPGSPAKTTKHGLPVKKLYPPSGPNPLSDVPVTYGLSPSLARSQGDDISDYLVNICRRPYTQAKLEPEQLSSDWRAYTGFDVIFYTAADWLEVPAAVRAAILQWVATGGELRLVTPSDNGLGLPALDGERYGAGFVRIFSADELANYDYATASYEPDERMLFNAEYGKTTPPAPAAAQLPMVSVTTQTPATYGSQKPHLTGEFGPAALVILVFGVLVGPVNLFWFCRGARRARLLWVTPLISLVTAALLGGFILISEGIGGTGIFYRVTLFEPQGKFATVTEVLSYKTGLLLRRQFQLPDPAWIVVKGTRTSTQSDFEVGPLYWGDWVGSRREQTLHLIAVSPSRAAVRVAGGAGAPSVISEYNGVLEAFYYRDADGKSWKTARLLDGQTTKLEPATDDEFNAAWKQHFNLAPPEIQQTLWRLAPQPGSFFALSPEDPSSFEPNVYGLHWTCFRHVVTGRVEK